MMNIFIIIKFLITYSRWISQPNPPRKIHHRRHRCRHSFVCDFHHHFHYEIVVASLVVYKVEERESNERMLCVCWFLCALSFSSTPSHCRSRHITPLLFSLECVFVWLALQHAHPFTCNGDECVYIYHLGSVNVWVDIMEIVGYLMKCNFWLNARATWLRDRVYQ